MVKIVVSTRAIFVTAVVILCVGFAAVVMGRANPVQASASSNPPTHGVNKQGYCTPMWIGNVDCWHESSVIYKTKAACQKDLKGYAPNSGQKDGVATGYCGAFPPEGYYKLQAYSSLCKITESLQACRKRGGH